MTVTPEPPAVPEADTAMPSSAGSRQGPPAAHREPPPSPSHAGATAGSRPPADRPAGLPFRPAVLLVALLAVVGMAGVIVVFGDGGGGSSTVSSAGGGSASPSGTDTPAAPVTIPDPSALAPPGGVPVPPSEPGAVMEWRTAQDWSAVLAWYYSSFPIDGMALDPVASGQSSVGSTRTGESHPIIPEGASTTPGLSPYLQIEADPDDPTGTIVSYITYG